MSLTLAELASSPNHFLHSFEGDNALFVPMDREAYRRSIFLDRRISPAGEGAMHAPLSALQGIPLVMQETGWIFHVAHCGSTLLARALEALGSNLVLKEPLALRQVAIDPDPVRTGLVLSLLGRRYEAGKPSLVKANVPVNFMLDAIAQSQPDSPTVILYWDLRDYLVAILRSDNHRVWLRSVTDLLARHVGDMTGASDAERATALWLAQVQRFIATIKAMPRARTLEAGRLFGDPAGSVAAAALLFGIEADPATIGQLVNGPLFKTYSKRPDVAFDNADRIARVQAVAAELEGELLQAADWLTRQGINPAALEAELAAAAL